MFIDHEVVLGVAYPTARARLISLAREGGFTEVSGNAYSHGLEGLIRVGPFGDLPGASKLVRVLLLDAIEHDGSLTLPLRWEATGVMGRLFPVLDANLTLAGTGKGTSLLRLNGVYRPPFASVGQGLDRALLHRAATATVRSLVRDVAGVLGDPDAAPVAEPGMTPLRAPGSLPRLGAEPDAFG